MIDILMDPSTTSNNLVLKVGTIQLKLLTRLGQSITQHHNMIFTEEMIILRLEFEHNGIFGDKLIQ